MQSEVIHKHTITLNPHECGGQSLILTTTYHDNGELDLYDRKKELHKFDHSSSIFINQKLTLHSECNSASFELIGAILTPDILRQLASELEKNNQKARNIMGSRKLHKMIEYRDRKREATGCSAVGYP